MEKQNWAEEMVYLIRTATQISDDPTSSGAAIVLQSYPVWENRTFTTLSLSLEMGYYLGKTAPFRGGQFQIYRQFCSNQHSQQVRRQVYIHEVRVVGKDRTVFTLGQRLAHDGLRLFQYGSQARNRLISKWLKRHQSQSLHIQYLIKFQALFTSLHECTYFTLTLL